MITQLKEMTVSEFKDQIQELGTDTLIEQYESIKAEYVALEEKKRELTKELNLRAKLRDKKRGTVHLKTPCYDVTIKRDCNVTYAKPFHGAPDTLYTLANQYPILQPLVNFKATEKTSPMLDFLNNAQSPEQIEAKEAVEQSRQTSYSAYIDKITRLQCPQEDEEILDEIRGKE